MYDSEIISWIAVKPSNFRVVLLDKREFKKKNWIIHMFPNDRKCVKQRHRINFEIPFHLWDFKVSTKTTTNEWVSMIDDTWHTIELESFHHGNDR